MPVSGTGTEAALMLRMTHRSILGCLGRQLFMMEEQRQRKYHTYAVRIQRAYRLWKSRKYFIDLRAMCTFFVVCFTALRSSRCVAIGVLTDFFAA